MSFEPFVIAPVAGHAPEAGRLVAMLTYVRATTLQAVEALTVDQLDHRHDGGSNSIGMLLAHIAAVERVYQIQTFEQRAPDADELQRWKPALELGEAAWMSIRGRSLTEYVNELEEVRRRTLDAFARIDDSWLDERAMLDDGRPINRYWQWFHVFEDELNHRGQIRWLRARLPV